VPAKVIARTQDLHASLAAQTRQLPWRDVLADRPDARAPASAHLHAMRVQHFFGGAPLRGQES
jgi:hypothetical protein